MIKADIQPIHSGNTSRTGYYALYEMTADADIDSGVILAAIINGETYLFQLAKTVNILSKSYLEYINGSEIEYLEEIPGHIPIDCIPIGSVRYPTKAELEWYDKQDLV